MITEAVLAPVATGVRDIAPLLDTVVIAGNARERVGDAADDMSSSMKT